MRLSWLSVEYLGRLFKEKKIRLVHFLFLFLVLGALCVGYYLYTHRNHAIKNPEPLSTTKLSSGTVSQAVEKNRSYNAQKLANNEIEDYQQTYLSYVDSYLYVKDYDSANKLLKEISGKVPADQLDPLFYRFSSEVAQHSGNIALYKENMQKLIESLRKAGRNEEADAYAKKLGNS
jgi:hypothetical protein